MATKRMTVEELWKLERPAQPTLSPDGAQACVSVTAFDMEQNKGAASVRSSGHTHEAKARRRESGNHLMAKAPVARLVTRRASPPSGAMT